MHANMPPKQTSRRPRGYPPESQERVKVGSVDEEALLPPGSTRADYSVHSCCSGCSNGDCIMFSCVHLIIPMCYLCTCTYMYSVAAATVFTLHPTSHTHPTTHVTATRTHFSSLTPNWCLEANTPAAKSPVAPS